MAHDDDDDDIDDQDEDGDGHAPAPAKPAAKMPMATVAVLGAAAALCVGLAVVLHGGKEKPGAEATPAVTAEATPGADPLADLVSPGIDLGSLIDAGGATTPGAGGSTPSAPTGGRESTPALDLGSPTAQPTPAPLAGTPTTPTPAPSSSQSTPAPSQATPAQVASNPTPAPSQATPTPSQATPTPSQATPAPSQATPAPAKATAQATPAPAASTPAAASDPNMSYDKVYLAGLAGKAGSGGLSDAEIGHLKAATPGNDAFGRAYALLAAHYESKKNYKGHCEIANAVVAQAAHKYNPDWNLELAKCRLRNGEYDGAAKAADNVVSEQMNLAAQTRAQRVMLAYQIKAKARTAQYEADAKKNSGFGDERLLNMAIGSWREVKSWAQNVNDNNGAESANRELTDLESKRAPKAD